MHPHNTNRDAFHTQRQQQNDKKEDEEGVERKEEETETRTFALLFAAAAAEGRWYKQVRRTHTESACVAQVPQDGQKERCWIGFFFCGALVGLPP